MFFLYLIATIFCSISVFAAEFTTVSLPNNSQINSNYELNNFDTLVSRRKPSDDQIKKDQETLKKNPSVALDKLDTNNRTIFHISHNNTIIQAAITALESLGRSPDLYDNNKKQPSTYSDSSGKATRYH